MIPRREYPFQDLDGCAERARRGGLCEERERTSVTDRSSSDQAFETLVIELHEGHQ